MFDTRYAILDTFVASLVSWYKLKPILCGASIRRYRYNSTQLYWTRCRRYTGQGDDVGLHSRPGHSHVQSRLPRLAAPPTGAGSGHLLVERAVQSDSTSGRGTASAALTGDR